MKETRTSNSASVPSAEDPETSEDAEKVEEWNVDRRHRGRLK